MKLNQLPSIVSKSKRRVGRGGGSTKGFHVAGRGQKGQKSRSKVAMWFEGGQLPLSRRIPFLRGKDRFKKLSADTVTINLEELNTIPEGTQVDRQTLVEHNLLSLKEAAEHPVKILARGDLTVKLTFKNLDISAAAAKKIEKVGGKIETE